MVVVVAGAAVGLASGSAVPSNVTVTVAFAAAVVVVVVVAAVAVVVTTMGVAKGEIGQMGGRRTPRLAAPQTCSLMCPVRTTKALPPLVLMEPHPSASTRSMPSVSRIVPVGARCGRRSSAALWKTLMTTTAMHRRLNPRMRVMR